MWTFSLCFCICNYKYCIILYITLPYLISQEDCVSRYKYLADLIKKKKEQSAKKESWSFTGADPGISKPGGVRPARRSWICLWFTTAQQESNTRHTHHEQVFKIYSCLVTVRLPKCIFVPSIVIYFIFLDLFFLQVATDVFFSLSNSYRVLVAIHTCTCTCKAVRLCIFYLVHTNSHFKCDHPCIHGLSNNCEHLDFYMRYTIKIKWYVLCHPLKYM